MKSKRISKVEKEPTKIIDGYNGRYEITIDGKIISNFGTRKYLRVESTSGTLIKPEAEDLIRVFQDHHVPEAFVANLNINDTVDLLVKNTSHETRENIMHKYYSGKL